jgi:glycosyltransferase involved in cell wall biosynthesis
MENANENCSSSSWLLGPGEVGLVSVIVTAYNQKEFIAETLASVASQTYSPVECIIVDDGSSDGTDAEVANFVLAHQSSLRIKSIRQKNQGAQCARNTGVSASTGEFIQFLDGDDILSADKLQVQVDAFCKAPIGTVDVVYGNSQWLEEQKNGFNKGGMIGTGPTKDILETMLNQKWNSPFAYLSRRHIVEANGPWDPSIPINQDFDYFLRMACRTDRFKYLPTNTGLYRRHSRPRISDGSMALRARATLAILKTGEKLAQANGMLTAARIRALAAAYRRVSYWSYGLDRSVWRECLSHFLRLCPDLSPETLPARCIQPVIGIWASESILGVIRESKRKYLQWRAHRAPRV